MKNYVNDYQNMPLTIPAFIWNNMKINGIEKQMMALLYKLTLNGNEPQKYLTRKLAQVNGIEEEELITIIDRLTEKGYVIIDKINADRYINVVVTKLMIKTDQYEPAKNKLF
jgi:hypothetical protein